MGELLIKEHEVVVRIVTTQSEGEVPKLLQPVPPERRTMIFGWVDETRTLLERQGATLRAGRPPPRPRLGRGQRGRR